MSALDIVINYHEALLKGLFVTLQLFLFTSIIGISAGVLLGALSAKYKNSVGIAVKIVSFVVASIPILVLLFWLHFPLQSILRVVINPFYTAIAALSIVNIVVIADLVRNVLTDFPKQYVVVAQMCGMSAKDVFKKIQFPIVLRQILPSLLIIQVNILQATLFASLISVEEIFRVAQRINATIYKPVEIYTSLAILFIIVLAPLNYFAYMLKQRYTRNLSER